MAKVPKTRTDLAPISEINKITQPVAQRDKAGDQINPATEDTLSNQLDITLSALRDAIKDYLSRATETSVASGDATGGSTTTLEDSSAVYELNKWKDAIVEITDVSTGKHYYVTVASNTVGGTLTFPAIAVAVVAGDHYEIRMVLSPTNMNKWGGTSLTPRDISGDLAKLDLALTDLRDAITAALVNKATTPVIYNVAMTDANGEYSQVLPANTKKYTIQTRDGTAFRMAFVTGKVATPTEPYFSIDTDGFHHEDLIEPAALTLFFACGEAAKVIEIIAWS